MKRDLLIGVFFLTLVSCQYSNSLRSDKKLTKKIEAKFKSKVTDLTELNSFEWDQLLILGPYAVIDNIEKILNLDLENIKENGIKSSDTINLLVFIKDGKSVKICEVTRNIGDFVNLGKLIKKNKAKFIKTTKGQNILIK